MDPTPEPAKMKAGCSLAFLYKEFRNEYSSFSGARAHLAIVAAMHFAFQTTQPQGSGGRLRFARHQRSHPQAQSSSKSPEATTGATTQARPLGSQGFPALQRRPWNGSTGLGRTPGPRICRLHDEGSIQPEGTARHGMASNLVELRCHRRTGQQKFHENKTRYQNIPSRYQIRASVLHEMIRK
jgi:hypothetical protein